MSGPTAKTTVPSDLTEGADPSSHALGLRWVFPTTDGAVTMLRDAPLCFGRGEQCDVQLDGNEISRQHAQIVPLGPVWVLRDAGSRNGVFLNGEPTEEAPLSVGDVIRLGECIAVVVHNPIPPQAGQSPFRALAPELLVGPVLAALLEPLQQLSASDLPIVIEGQTGTGKECVARAIHRWSGRTGRFVGVNCAALPETLAEAELFGYRRGAFTGAELPSEGHLRAAHGGTLLLDEASDLPLALQAKLLRVLEQREVVPLGETKPVAVDLRVVVATQQSLAEAVAQGRFRSDLFARLNGYALTLPPLSERIEEIPYLFQELLRRQAGGPLAQLDPRLIEQLCLCELPFNVRELALLARRLMVLHGHEPLRRRHLPERYLVHRSRATTPSDAPAPRTKPSSEGELFEALRRALRTHHGVVARAAAELEISRQRAYRLLEAHGGIDLDELRNP